MAHREAGGKSDPGPPGVTQASSVSLAHWTVNLLGPLGDHFVISPGSRSTPLVVGARILCELDEKRKRHLVRDERSAGFFALGLSKAGKRPVLICTSGSALSHYYPALLEAHRAALPFIVVSADRPPYLLGCGANQTIGQADFYGEHVRRFFDAGLPSGEALAQVVNLSMQARRSAEGGDGLPGPVHINAPFEKPLEPSDEVEEAPPRFKLGSWRKKQREETELGEWPQKIREAVHPVIVAGPSHHVINSATRAVALERLSELCIPLLAERTSAYFSPDALPLDPLMRALSTGSQTLTPDLIIQVGNTPTSPWYPKWLKRIGKGTKRLVMSEHGLQDPWHEDPEVAAFESLFGDELHLLSELFAETQLRRKPNWLSQWTEAFEQTQKAINDLRTELGEGEALVASAVLKATKKRGYLVVGNSLPVRLLETWGLSTRPDVRVVSRRGVSGIDGLIATAAGLITANEKPAVVWSGDVTLLHDIGSLALCKDLPAPMVIVVVNNGGGRIFEQLPVASEPSTRDDMAMFTSPHDVEFSHAARLFGMRYVRADIEGLEACIRGSFGQTESSLVEVLVSPRSASEAERALRALFEPPSE